MKLLAQDQIGDDAQDEAGPEPELEMEAGLSRDGFQYRIVLAEQLLGIGTRDATATLPSQTRFLGRPHPGHHRLSDPAQQLHQRTQPLHLL